MLRGGSRAPAGLLLLLLLFSPCSSDKRVALAVPACSRSLCGGGGAKHAVRLPADVKWCGCCHCITHAGNTVTVCSLANTADAPGSVKLLLLAGGLGELHLPAPATPALSPRANTKEGDEGALAIPGCPAAVAAAEAAALGPAMLLKGVLLVVVFCAEVLDMRPHEGGRLLLLLAPLDDVKDGGLPLMHGSRDLLELLVVLVLGCGCCRSAGGDAVSVDTSEDTKLLALRLLLLFLLGGLCCCCCCCLCSAPLSAGGPCFCIALLEEDRSCKPADRLLLCRVAMLLACI